MLSYTNYVYTYTGVNVVDDGAIARRAITFKQEFNLQALDSGLKDKKKVKKGKVA